MLLSALFIITMASRPGGATTAAKHTTNAERPSLELRISRESHARAVTKGLVSLVRIADRLDFYARHRNGSRENILSGPWNGAFRDDGSGSYTLSGDDPLSGAAYSLEIRQNGANRIDLNISLKAPLQPSNIDLQIVKISGDLFKGSLIDTSPRSQRDAGMIPVEPLPMNKRTLLTDKVRMSLKGSFCDLEITDKTGMKSIQVTDFRNVPWDNQKSILVSAGQSNLSPGKSYSFKYSIKCLPPSRTDIVQAAGISSYAVDEFHVWSFFNILPKKETKKNGYYRLRVKDHIYGSPSGTAEAVLVKEITKLTAIHPDVRPPGPGKAERGIVIERIMQVGTGADIPPEGFEIVTSPDSVIIRGADERGCLYGVYALLGSIGQKNGAWEIGCGTIKDWPDLPIRGGCLAMSPPAIHDVGIMKRYLDAYSRARSNFVIFLHDPRQVRSWTKNADDGWTKKEMAEIVQYARWLQMDVWGGMGSHFRQADFPEMEIRDGTNFYNPFNEKNYHYLFSLYEEILKTYAPSTLLVSHDEMHGLSVYASVSGKSTAEIFATDITHIRDWLSNRNVQTAIWGDMLLDHGRWETEAGSANSLNPFFKSGATHDALQQLPKDVFILDWHYGEKDRYASVDYFHKNGFRVAGVVWHEPKAARNMAESVKTLGGQGILATDWGFWRTMSPAATTLYAPLCGWSIKCRTDEMDDDVMALAETMRSPFLIDKQTPVSLKEASNRSSRDLQGRGGKSLFGVGPVLDLRALHTGNQVLGSVLFDILPDNGGRKNNCVVVSNDSRSSGESKAVTLFKGNAMVRGIAFLHTGFIEEPMMNVRKLGRYLVEYEDGSSESIDLLENWNITDIRSTVGLRHNDWTFLKSPDVLIGSKTVWRGSSAIGIPLNLQLFIWNNPHREKKIKSIKMIAADEPKGTKLALLGLTLLNK